MSAHGFVGGVHSVIHVVCRGRCFVKFNFDSVSVCSFYAVFGSFCKKQ